ncbi:peptidyl-prolyl cis-trans isomerase [Bacillus sp. YC2]|uniref:peptidyl-prolyl cis-trans isomerase n=1 Tax=Bacillus sp. YC2 TaxID=2861287 RepID=UPI001CA67176|nr:peptidyl-prolyl cis-trans isomerase [Bacillus sp. YC2]MBY8912331.1 peptidyl-prolyl cis-trans isomerase [Bacillus sp. YC2]
MSVIQVKGNVTYPITIDPSVWIFDDRKFPFEKQQPVHPDGTAETDEHTIDTERVIREGRISPPTLKSEKRFEKEKLMNGSFAMKLGAVLSNAEPKESAVQCVFISDSKRTAVPLEKALESIAHFSEAGKPLQDGGPIHIYVDENFDEPITGVKEIEVL